MSSDDACFRLLDRIEASESFEPGTCSTSPWSTELLHGGPVGALLARAIERLKAGDDAGRIGRVSVEILGPVRLAPVTVEASVLRPGRRISLRQATMSQLDANGVMREVARAQAWWLAGGDTASVVHRPGGALRLPGADTPALAEADVPDSWRTGFIGSMEWRVPGAVGFAAVGDPAVAWMRMTTPLVDGESTTALQRAVATADTANGIGARLDADHWTFINTDLTVHLFDLPPDEWIGVEAESAIGPDGIGTGTATLHGTAGPFARVSQCLLVEPRAR